MAQLDATQLHAVLVGRGVRVPPGPLPTSYYKELARNNGIIEVSGAELAAAGVGGGGGGGGGAAGATATPAAGGDGGGDSGAEAADDDQMSAGERDTSSVRELLQALVTDIGASAVRAAVAPKTAELVSSAAELVASTAEPALRRLRTAGSELRAQVAPDLEEAGALLGEGSPGETVGQAVATLDALGGRLAEALDAGWEKALRAALLRRAGSAATSAAKAGRSIRRLTSRLEAYETRVERAVTGAGAKWRRHVPKGGAARAAGDADAHGGVQVRVGADGRHGRHAAPGARAQPRRADARRE